MEMIVSTTHTHVAKDSVTLCGHNVSDPQAIIRSADNIRTNIFKFLANHLCYSKLVCKRLDISIGC